MHVSSPTDPTRRAPGGSRLAVAGLLAATTLLLAACGSSASSASPVESPSAASASASASAEPSTPAEPSAPVASGAIGPCGPDDVTAQATSSGGAAGSRGADVSIAAVGAASCHLPSTPMVAMIDPTGQAILQTPISVGTDGPVVSAAAGADFTYEISNWCSPTTSTPWHVVLATAVGTIPVSGIQYGADDLPPCNGPGQPPQLTTSSWTTAAP